MAVITAESKKQIMSSFLDALNRHDADAMMSHMSDDCMFETAGGPEVYGYRYLGREDVRAGYSSLWDGRPDALWVVTSLVVCGERAFSEWTVSATQPDGTRFESNGVDLFTFDEGNIAVVISYRKYRTQT